MNLPVVFTINQNCKVFQSKPTLLFNKELHVSTTLNSLLQSEPKNIKERHNTAAILAGDTDLTNVLYKAAM